MSRVPRFLLSVFGASFLLLAIFWLLLRFDFLGMTFHVYSIGIDTLDKLHEIGFPHMTREVGWPEPTHLGSLVLLFLWWLVYFLIALVVGLLIRRFRFHRTPTV
jgi:hypothetical protein